MINQEKLIVSDYNPTWASQFESLKKVLVEYLGTRFISIEHVGSTSIPGMKAKPIIDLDIVIEDNAKVFEDVIAVLDELGYKHLGDLGITGRAAFKRDDYTPNVPSNKKWFKHNLYVCQEGSIGLLNHRNLRDYLLKNPQKVIEYSSLKAKLVAEFPYDIDAYIDGKTDFIVEILNELGMDKANTELIEQQNRMDSQESSD